MVKDLVCWISFLTAIAGTRLRMLPRTRTPEEIEEWEKYDPVKTFAEQLIGAKVATKKKVEEIQQFAQKRVENMFLLATDPEVSPHVDFKEESGFR